MAKYERELEKYEVHYEKEKRTFQSEDEAIRFATELENKGLDPTIKEINILVGWY